jgi:hypothetical protein
LGDLRAAGIVKEDRWTAQGRKLEADPG